MPIRNNRDMTSTTTRHLDPGEDTKKLLRNALGQFATGVTIVTTLDDNGDYVGMTVNSFSSVSLDPPLILWSISETSYGIDVFRGASHFCINILSTDQVNLAQKFSQASEEKFNGLAIARGLNGIPLIEGCLAHFECTTEARYPGGDHIILLGRVMRFASVNKDPLLFHSGQFYDLRPVSIEAAQGKKPAAKTMLSEKTCSTGN